MTEDTPAIKAWKIASPKHRMKEAEKKLKLLYVRIPHEVSSELADEWRREYEAVEQEFLRACSEVYADEEQCCRNYPEEIEDQ